MSAYKVALELMVMLFELSERSIICAEIDPAMLMGAI